MESGLWWGSQSEGTAEVEMRAGVCLEYTKPANDYRERTLVCTVVILPLRVRTYCGEWKSQIAALFCVSLLLS